MLTKPWRYEILGELNTPGNPVMQRIQEMTNYAISCNQSTMVFYTISTDTGHAEYYALLLDVNHRQYYSSLDDTIMETKGKKGFDSLSKRFIHARGVTNLAFFKPRSGWTSLNNVDLEFCDINHVHQFIMSVNHHHHLPLIKILSLNKKGQLTPTLPMDTSRVIPMDTRPDGIVSELSDIDIRNIHQVIIDPIATATLLCFILLRQACSHENLSVCISDFGLTLAQSYTTDEHILVMQHITKQLTTLASKEFVRLHDIGTNRETGQQYCSIPSECIKYIPFNLSVYCNLAGVHQAAVFKFVSQMTSADESCASLILSTSPQKTTIFVYS
tara:strand:- start:14182 stop:15168 length:987 start_codon:yes stop_codon:yes gene_type:complete